MAADGHINIDTKIDGSGFQAGLKRISSMASDALGLMTKLIDGAGAALSGAAEAGVSFNAQMQQYVTSFGTMLSGASRAQELISQLKKYASGTPFEFSDLAKGTQTILAFGTSVQGVIPDLKALGDASQDTAAQFSALSLSFAEVSGAVKMQEQDFLQLVNAGFTPLNEMAGKTGKSMAELSDKMQKGKTSTQGAADALQSASSQSETFTGKLSKLADDASQILGKMTQGIESALNGTAAPMVTNWLAQMKTAFASGDVESVVEGFANALYGAFKGVDDVATSIIALQDFGKEVKKLMGPVTNFSDNLDTIKIGAMLAGDGVKKFGKNLGTDLHGGITKAGGAFKSFGEKVSSFGSKLEGGISKIGPKLEGGISKIGPKLEGVMAKIGPGLLSGISKIGGAFQAFFGILSDNPIILIIAGVVALVAAIVYLWNTNEGFRNAVIGVWNAIVGFFQGVGTAITGFFTSAWNAISGIWGAVTGFFSGVWSGIQGVFSLVGSWFLSIFSGAWNSICGIWGTVTGFFSGVWSGIQGAFSSVGSWFSNTFSGAWNGIQSAWTGAQSWFGGVWNGIKGHFQPDTISKGFGSAWSGIQGAWSGAQSWFGGVWGGIKGHFQPDTISKGFGSAWSGIQGAWRGAGSWFGGIWDSIKGGFKALNPFSWGGDLIDGIARGIRDAAQHVRDAVNNVAKDIRSFLHFSRPDTGPLSEYEKWMPDFMAGLANGVTANKYKVSTAIGGMTADISAAPVIRPGTIAKMRTQITGMMDQARTAISAEQARFGASFGASVQYQVAMAGGYSNGSAPVYAGPSTVKTQINFDGREVATVIGPAISAQNGWEDK